MAERTAHSAPAKARLWQRVAIGLFQGTLALGLLLQVLLIGRVEDGVLHLDARLANYLIGDQPLQMGQVRASLDGQILLHDVSYPLIRDDVSYGTLHADLIYLRWNQLSEIPVHVLRVANASFTASANLTPSGIEEPLLQSVSLHADFEDNAVTYHLSGKAMTLPFLATGQQLPITSDAAEPTLEITPAQFRDYLKQAHDHISRTTAPMIRLTSNGDAVTVQLSADAHTTADWQCDNPAITAKFQTHLHQIHGQVSAQALQLTSHPQFLERDLELSLGFQAAQFQYAYTLANDHLSLSGRLSDGHLADLPIRGLVLNADGPRASPSLSAQVGLANSWAVAKWQPGSGGKAHHARLNGRIQPQSILETTAFPKMDALDSLHFGDPIKLMADLQFDSAYGWKAADFELMLGQASYGDIALTQARATGTITPEGIHADFPYAATADYTVTGSYWQNFQSNRYRIRTDGRLRPTDLNTLINEDWWNELWAGFEFQAQPPRGDMDLHGAYGGGRAAKWMFLYTEADTLAYEGIPLEQLRTKLYLLPKTLTLFDLEAISPDGNLLATLHFQQPLDRDGREFITLDATSTLQLESVSKLIGESMQKPLAMFSSDYGPKLSAVAKYYDTASPRDGDLYLDLTAHFDEAVLVKGFYLDELQFRAINEPSKLTLPRINARLGDGTGVGQAVITTSASEQRLSGQAKLENVEHHRLVAAMAGKAETDPDAGDADSVDAGLIDLEAEFAGKLGDLRDFSGKGKIVLREAEIAKLRIFGGLTRTLEGIGVNFGSLAIDGGSSSLILERGYLLLPDINLTGPTARVEANGYMAIPTEALRFNASVWIFGEVTKPVISQVLNTVGALSGAIAIQLEGTLDAPKWNASLKPSGIFNSPPKVKLPQASP